MAPLPPRTQSFSFELTSDATEVARLCEHLFTNAVKAKYQRVGAEKSASVTAHVRALVLNAFEAYSLDPESPAVAYSRDRNEYSNRALSYDTFVGKVLPALKDGGYVTCHNTARSAWAEDEEPKRSCYLPTPKLVQLFGEFGIRLWMLRYARPTDLVVCKGPKVHGMKVKPRVPVPIGALEQVRSAQVVLRRANRLLEHAFVGYFVADDELRRQQQRRRGPFDRTPAINIFRKILYRVFNDVRPSDQQLQRGGRFVGGWWQHVPREFRRGNVWINDSFSVELDFGAMEPTIAYALKNVSVWDLFEDPYAIDGLPKEQARGVIKSAFLVAINSGAQTVGVAVRKVRNKLYIEYVKRLLRNKPKAPIPKQHELSDEDLLWLDAPSLREIVRKVFEVHSLVLPANKDAGNHRMFLESRITEFVLDKFSRKGVVILPVHDSFLVHPTAGDFLLDVMGDAHDSVLRRFARIRRIPFSVETSVIADVFLRHASFYLGPTPEKDWKGSAAGRAYPWSVDRSQYSLFFELWKSTGRDVDAEIARAQAFHEGNAEHGGFQSTIVNF